MREKIEYFLRGFGIIFGQFLLILFALTAGAWIAGTLLITWAMSRT